MVKKEAVVQGGLPGGVFTHPAKGGYFFQKSSNTVIGV